MVWLKELTPVRQIEFGHQRHVIAPAEPIVRIAHLERREARSLRGRDEEIIHHEAAAEMALMIMRAAQRVLS
jgi:hypothetical protein